MRADTVTAVMQGFRRERAEDLEVVRGWVRAVVRGGNWRFGDPEGVVQDVLLKLVRIVRDGRVEDPGGFQKFVYTVAKNTCVTLYHRERSRAAREGGGPPPEDIAGGHNPHAGLERRERLALMVHIYQRLPEGCRRLWELVYGEGLAAEAVARRLGITPNNVRVRVHRCLQRGREIHRQIAGRGAPAERGNR